MVPAEVETLETTSKRLKYFLALLDISLLLERLRETTLLKVAWFLSRIFEVESTPGVCLFIFINYQLQ